VRSLARSSTLVLSPARSSGGSLGSMRAKSLYVVSSPRLASRPEEEEEEEEGKRKEKEDSLTYVIHGHTVYKHCSQVSQCKHCSQGSQCSQSIAMCSLLRLSRHNFRCQHRVHARHEFCAAPAQPSKTALTVPKVTRRSLDARGARGARAAPDAP